MNVKVQVWAKGSIVNFAFGDKKIELYDDQARELAGLIYRAAASARQHRAGSSSSKTVVVGFNEAVYAHDDPEPFIQRLNPLPEEDDPHRYGDAFANRPPVTKNKGYS